MDPITLAFFTEQDVLHAPSKADRLEQIVPAESVGSIFDLPGCTDVIVLPQLDSTVLITCDSQTVKNSSATDL